MVLVMCSSLTRTLDVDDHLQIDQHLGNHAHNVTTGGKGPGGEGAHQAGLSATVDQAHSALSQTPSQRLRRVGVLPPRAQR